MFSFGSSSFFSLIFSSSGLSTSLKFFFSFKVLFLFLLLCSDLSFNKDALSKFSICFVCRFCFILFLSLFKLVNFFPLFSIYIVFLLNFFLLLLFSSSIFLLLSFNSKLEFFLSSKLICKPSFSLL